jgi:EAL domain-containing protein (putative c-di-GMP-specific phosphodiesterase class I)
VKVDRSFVSGMSADATDRELVAAVVGMGRALKLCVVAEGIETAEQAEVLREMGCDIGQGYLFSRPVAGDELEALVSAGVPLQAAPRL